MPGKETRYGCLDPEIVMIGLSACCSMVFRQTECRCDEKYLISEFVGLVIFISRYFVHKCFCFFHIFCRHGAEFVVITHVKVFGKHIMTHKVGKLPQFVLVAALKDVDLFGFSFEECIERI